MEAMSTCLQTIVVSYKR